MSWRIETADPFTLMRELPNKWAQTCFLRPPELTSASLVAILDEVHRVLRDDGTLWISLPRRGNTHSLFRAVKDAGWLRASTSLPDRAGDGSYRGVALFSKQQHFHINPRQPPLETLPRHRLGQATPRTSQSLSGSLCVRRGWCVAARDPEDALSPELIRWCILAGTSRYACGVCGAPWKRLAASPRRSGRWQPICPHNASPARCLVLDVFCGAGAVGASAVRVGRSYLGIERDAESATRATRLLSDIQPESRR